MKESGRKFSLGGALQECEVLISALKERCEDWI